MFRIICDTCHVKGRGTWLVTLGCCNTKQWLFEIEELLQT
jgi:hypothetical protein